MNYGYREHPGIYIYPDFEYPDDPNTFMTAVVAQIDPEKYWTDRPILISSKKPLMSDAINLDQTDIINAGAQLTPEYPIQETFDQIEDLPKSLRDMQNQLQEATQKLYEVDWGSASGSGLPPELEPPYQDWQQAIDEADQAYYHFTDNIEDIRETGAEIFKMPEMDEVVMQSFKEMSKEKYFWYGIPLINLSERHQALADSYILQVNAITKKLEVTNIVTLGLHFTDLVIDREIPPGKRFLAGFFSNMQRVGIFLRIEDDPVFYFKYVQFNPEPEALPKVTSFGCDNEFKKNFKGYFWDLLFWDKPYNFNHNVPSQEPEYPMDGYVFDFGTTSEGNTIKSVNGGTARSNSRGDSSNGIFFRLRPLAQNIPQGFPGVHPWSFIWDSYVDNFFCRKVMDQGAFTISWLQWLPIYSKGIKTFVADEVNSNYIKYDFDRKEFIILFNGYKYTQKFTLPLEKWYFCTVRFDGDQTVSLLYTDFERQYRFDFNIGTGLEFELIAMFAHYNRDEMKFTEIPRSLNGTLMVFEKFKTDEEINRYCDEVIKYMRQYIPRRKDLLDLSPNFYF